MNMSEDQKEDIKDLLEINTGLDVVKVINVWSNGRAIRRYQGQNEGSVKHNPKNGYRKMVAILVEESDINE